MRRTVVLNVVGLTRALLPSMPRLSAFAREGHSAAIRPAFPAVTCTAQSSYLTGLAPAEHGIVGNGCTTATSPKSISGNSPTISCTGRSSGTSCARATTPSPARSFSGGTTCTPRSTGRSRRARSIPPTAARSSTSTPAPLALRPEIKADLGEFPFPSFWGPAAGIDSSRWIAAAARWIEEKRQPTLSLVYLPHLDYNLQRLGPRDPKIADDLRLIDDVTGELIDFFRARGVQVAVLSEYGITEVDTPVQLNRVLRRHGWLSIKDELGLETLDCGGSRAFAVAITKSHTFISRFPRSRAKCARRLKPSQASNACSTRPRK